MSASTTTDQPGIDARRFSASLVETPGLDRSLTVSGEAFGDYRVQQGSLMRAKPQGSNHTLVIQDPDGAGPLLRASRARWPFVVLGYADGGYAGPRAANLRRLAR